ncbi:MAG: spore coat U domain-containing protein [Syntrophales bacterium]|nr:spore coat U domain-containing protein [Syntrophales bacterium]
MKKAFTFFVMLTVLIFAGGTVIAATVTQNLSVGAQVVAKCSIQNAGPLNFGDYDVTSSTPTDAQASMTFKCTKGTTYKTYITGTRQMTNGTDNLNFQLYSDSNRSTIFPSDNSGSGEQAPNASPITKYIYGRIPAEQDVGTGTYSATLTATVEY